MGKINFRRVLAGGLVAGAIMIAGELIVHGGLLGDRWVAALEPLNIEISPLAGFTWSLGAFMAGIVALWIYAAIRPRFGAGPTTALKAATAIWVVVYLYPCIGMMGTPPFPRGLIAIAAVWGFVEVTLAVMVGAWLYREPEAT